jgi:hypothetical protein
MEQIFTWIEWCGPFAYLFLLFGPVTIAFTFVSGWQSKSTTFFRVIVITTLIFLIIGVLGSLISYQKGYRFLNEFSQESKTYKQIRFEILLPFMFGAVICTLNIIFGFMGLLFKQFTKNKITPPLFPK